MVVKKHHHHFPDSFVDVQCFYGRRRGGVRDAPCLQGIFIPVDRIVCIARVIAELPKRIALVSFFPGDFLEAQCGNRFNKKSGGSPADFDFQDKKMKGRFLLHPGATESDLKGQAAQGSISQGVF
jgi:hypothetical protein